MNLKSFLIASLIIHVIGGIFLYFYFNPIHLSPKPTPPIEKEKKTLAEKIKESLGLKKKSSENIKELEQPKEAESSFLLKNKAKSSSQKKGADFLKTFKSPPPKKEESKEESVPLPPQELEGIGESFNEESQETLNESGEEIPDDEEPSEETALQTENAEDIEREEVPDDEESAPPQTESMIDIESIEKEPGQTEETALQTENAEDMEIIEIEEVPPQAEEENIEPGEITEEVPGQTEEASPQTENAEDIEREEVPDDEESAPPQTESMIDIESIEKEPEQTEEIPPQTEGKKLKTAEIKNLVTPPEQKIKLFSPQIQDFQQLKQKRGNPSLVYPLFARREKMEGTVSVLFFVNQQGLVDKIQLEKSSGHPELDNFVIRRLARYEFLSNQESWVRHKIPFVLEGEEVESWELRKKQEE